MEKNNIRNDNAIADVFDMMYGFSAITVLLRMLVL